MHVAFHCTATRPAGCGIKWLFSTNSPGRQFLLLPKRVNLLDSTTHNPLHHLDPSLHPLDDLRDALPWQRAAIMAEAFFDSARTNCLCGSVEDLQLQLRGLLDAKASPNRAEHIS